MTPDNISLKDFPLKWRFAEDAKKWTMLPAKDLAHFHPLSKAASEHLWCHHVTTDVVHLGEARWNALLGSKIAAFETQGDWTTTEEEERARMFLQSHVSIAGSSPVIFFWHASCAVMTTWDLLLRYWSDFCYPSDDSNVAVPLEADVLIFYRSERMWLTRRLTH